MAGMGWAKAHSCAPWQNVMVGVLENMTSADLRIQWRFADHLAWEHPIYDYMPRDFRQTASFQRPLSDMSKCPPATCSVPALLVQFSLCSTAMALPIHEFINKDSFRANKFWQNMQCDREDCLCVNTTKAYFPCNTDVLRITTHCGNP